MACEDIDKLCYRWILEYDCWQMWTKFAQLGSVDGIPNRAGQWQDSPYPEKLDDSKSDGYRVLMFFMCKISDAANEVSDTATQHDVTVTPQRTNLEAAIDLVGRIWHHFSEVLESGEVKDVQLCLKRHAVLTPLRKNDRLTAKVYGRFICFWLLMFLQFHDESAFCRLY